ncbi:single-stranded DNA-binding protein [Fodinicola feengrottensis]|uniref:Single-stranded DNA-binding protein n=1 Tax=Fodinicola feengrottensis TaxID=435914 RepID=A0ABP4U4K3_9ACTN|nr:single-stranded DNA-binding protein [Fodinicola feengrottensis]
MPGLPEITIVGTLTADPEQRFTKSGIAVANFTVASNDRRYNKESGQWEDGDATFLRCSIWRDYAEHVSESLARGQRVIVVGQLRQRSYDTAEGEKRTVVEVDVREIGPALKWATVKVAKAKRGNANTTRNGGESDPWTAPAASAKASGYSEEPPF